MNTVLQRFLIVLIGIMAIPFWVHAQEVPFYSNGTTLSTDPNFRFNAMTDHLQVSHIDLNGVPYSWPQSYATGTSVLTNGGSGKLAWKPTCDRSNMYTRPPQLLATINFAALANNCIATLWSVYDEGNLVTVNPVAINFTGAGVITTQSNGVTTVSIPGASGGTTPPAGAHTQIQFNKNGAFGAASEFWYDQNLSALRIGDTNNNLIIGKWAAQNLQPGSAGMGQNNVILGVGTGQLTTTGGRNVFIGSGAAVRAKSASANVIIGQGAAFALTDGGSANVIIGDEAGHHTNTGYFNVILGRHAGYNNTSGVGNIYIGDNAGSNLTPATLENAIAIGRNAMVTANNSMVLGGYDHMAVNVSIGGDSTPDYRLDVDLMNNSGIVASFSNTLANCYIDPGNGNGGFFCTSDMRFKNDIKTLEGSLDIVNTIRPVHFTWNNDRENMQQTGFIAQELETIIPEAVRDIDGKKAVSYTTLIPYLVQSIQELNKKIEILEQEKQGELCIDDICMTRDELRRLLLTVRKSGSSRSNNSNTSAENSSAGLNTLEVTAVQAVPVTKKLSE